MKIAGLVPVLEKGSVEELGKLRFDDGRSLLKVYVDMLKNLDIFDEIVLAVSHKSDVNELMKEIEIGCMELPELANTHAITVAKSALADIDADIIVTCNYQYPFIEADHIVDCVDAVKSEKSKWAFTGQKRETLYWNMNDNQPINGNASGVKPVHVEIEAVYAFDKNIFETIGDEKPCIVEVDGAEVYGLKNPMGFEFLKTLYEKR